LKNRKKTPGDKIIYNGQEISFLLAQKIENIVSIIANRTLGGIQHDYDFVQGPVANDKIVFTITGFIDGLYTREEAMQRLMYSKTNDQVSLHTEKAVSFLKLKNRRKTPGDKIIYNGQEISFLLAQKIENIVSIIAEKDKISFDSAYNGFSVSQLYKSLQNPSSLLWAENADFIADEYYRERNN